MGSGKALKLAFILSATDKMSRIVGEAVKKSSNELSAFERRTAKVGSSMMKAGSIMTGVGVGIGAAAFGVAKSAAEYGDRVWKTSQKVGVGVEAWQKLAYAAKYSGIEQDALASGMNKFNKVMVAASSGSKEQAQIFKDLGVSLKDAQGDLRKPDDLFKEFAGIFSKIEDGAAKSDLAMKLFGKSGADLIPLLNSGTLGLKQMGEEAARMGFVISEDAAKASEKFNDDFDRVKDSAKGLAMQFGTALIPMLNELINKITDTVGKVTGWINKNPELVTTISKIALGLSTVLIGLGLVSVIMGGFTLVIGKFTALWRGAMTAIKVGEAVITAAKNSMLLFKVQYAALLIWQKLTATAQWLFNSALFACPITWIIIGIAAVIAAVVLLVKNWTGISSFFKKLWDDIKNTFSSVWEWIKGIFLNYHPYGLIIKHWDSISAWFSNLWNNVAGIFIGAWEGIRTFFGGLNPIEWITNMWDGISTFFSDLWGKFYNWGGDIINGLIDGIVGRAKKAVDSVKEVGKKIASGFKSFFGINSPSKLFAEYGVNITQGLAGGITKGEGSVVSVTDGLEKSVAASGNALQMVRRTGEQIKTNSVDSSQIANNINGSTTINYAPTITINGSDNSNTKQDFLKMLKAHRDEIVAMIKQASENKARLSFN